MWYTSQVSKTERAGILPARSFRRAPSVGLGFDRHVAIDGDTADGAGQAGGGITTDAAGGDVEVTGQIHTAFSGAAIARFPLELAGVLDRSAERGGLPVQRAFAL